jgi:hypothetical protein
MQRLRVRQPVQQELLVQQELPDLLEPLVCKSLAWQPVLQLGEQLELVLQLGEQLEQVMQLEVKVVVQRVPEALPVLVPLAVRQQAQLLRHRIRRR